jgi:hypothetical protein
MSLTEPELGDPAQVEVLGDEDGPVVAVDHFVVKEWSTASLEPMLKKVINNKNCSKRPSLYVQSFQIFRHLFQMSSLCPRLF